MCDGTWEFLPVAVNAPCVCDKSTVTKIAGTTRFPQKVSIQNMFSLSSRAMLILVVEQVFAWKHDKNDKNLTGKTRFLRKVSKRTPDSWFLTETGHRDQIMSTYLRLSATRAQRKSKFKKVCLNSKKMLLSKKMLVKTAKKCIFLFIGIRTTALIQTP